MLKPKPSQLSGARFLADRDNALLADEPRVGKTMTAIMAADYNFDETILVVTTASGRAVWRRAFKTLSAFPRNVTILEKPVDKIPAGVVIVSWNFITDPRMQVLLSRVRWHRVIGDEGHYAKSFEAKRTRAFYGELNGAMLLRRSAVTQYAKGVWILTGTPVPNAPNDLFPMLRALFPEALMADQAKGWPGVMTYELFLKQYCVTRPKKLSRWRSITIVMGGRNLDELQARVQPYMLRRTQQDVGIQAPIYEILPLLVTERMKRDMAHDVDATAVIEAAERGEKMDMHLGPLRRLTGYAKARAVAEHVREELSCGVDKIVLMAWHTDVIQILKDELAEFGVVTIDGSTPPGARGGIEQRFLRDPKIRVFVGQITAAGEAIDLSSAAYLIFVESSFVPKDMKQAALRITNHGQTRQALVRVAALEGSVDEGLQSVLMRKWTSIRGVLDDA